MTDPKDTGENQELWDVYNQYRHKTERIHVRGKEMKKGDYHLSVHVWIMNEDGHYLIQKRQSWKSDFPNMWDSSAAGSALKGDGSEQAAIREVEEELGIQLEIAKGERLFTNKFECGFDDVWLFRQNVDFDSLNLQEEEVADAKWASEAEIKEMVEAGTFIPYQYLDLLFEMAGSKISLMRATAEDAMELLSLQKEVFLPLYEKYRDHETSPATQTMERFLERFDLGDYYKIFFAGHLAGSVLVSEKEPGLKRLHIMNIRWKFQNKGIAQEVMKRLELMYPEAEAWELDTILSEERNCYLYEKMGYVRSGEPRTINEQMALVRYLKNAGLMRIIGFKKERGQ